MDPEKRSYYTNLAMVALCLVAFLALTIWFAYDALVVKKDFFQLFIGSFGSAFLTAAAIIPTLVLCWRLYTKRLVPGPDGRFHESLAKGESDPADPDKKYLWGVPVEYVNWYIALFLGVFIIGITYTLTRSPPITLVMAGLVLVFCAICWYLTHGGWGFLFLLMAGFYLFPILMLALYITEPVYAPDQFIPRIVASPGSAVLAFAIMLLPTIVIIWGKISPSTPQEDQ
jgi:hypothetical protein